MIKDLRNHDLGKNDLLKEPSLKYRPRNTGLRNSDLEIIMTFPKPIFERCKIRAESSAMAGCCCGAMPACRMLRWTVAALVGLLVLSSLAWAQTTLRTPAADDPQCLENDCPATPMNSQDSANPAPGRAGPPISHPRT